MMDIVFDVTEQTVNQTGMARYPFRLSAATHAITYQVEWAGPGFAVESRVRPTGSAEALTYELEIGPRDGRRMRPGEHHLVLIATASTSDDTATADFVLRVEPCVHVEDPTFNFDWLHDVATLTLSLSSRCRGALKCSVVVSYHQGTGSSKEIDLTVGVGPVKVEVPFPLGGQKDFDAHDVQITVHSDDGTVVSLRPGETPTVTWSPPSRPPRRLAPIVVAVGTGLGVLGVATAVAALLTYSTNGTPTGAKRSTATSSSSSSPRASGGNVAAAKVSLSSSPNPAKCETLTLTATVKGGSGGAPTGTVEFQSDGTSLGSVPVTGGIATLTRNLPNGQHALTATYGGDATHGPGTAPSTNQRVECTTTSTSTTATSATTATTATTTTTTMSLSSSFDPVSCDTTLTATVKGGSGGAPTGTVEFQSDGTSLGSVPVTGGIATLTRNLPNGQHALTATYGGDATHGPGTAPSTNQLVGCG